MTEEDRSYLARRARDEHAAAAIATNLGAARIHASMAAEYARRLETMQPPVKASAVNSASTPSSNRLLVIPFPE